MRFYTDVIDRRDPRHILYELERLAAPLVGADPNPGASRALESARDGLILAGMLEQALADNPECRAAPEIGASGHDDAGRALTDWWADRLAAPTGAPPPPNPPPLGEPGPLALVVPEGYLFYALFPDAFAEVGQAIAAERAGERYVVVGVLSIGASLSAAVAAGLRREACLVARHTVRPRGDPFSREVVAAPGTAHAWRAAADRGARFIVVDEGPGLSGSSIATTVDAVRAAGVPMDRIVVVCAHPPGPLANAGAAVRETWASVAVRTVEPVIESLLARRLPGLLGDACDGSLSFERDGSWGKWSASDASLLPGFERRKLFLSDRGGQRVVAKFVGFGAIGRQKAALTQRIAEAGMAPTYRGFAHGFLLQNWVGEAVPEALDSGVRAPIIDAAARYYAFVRHTAESGGHEIDFRDLSATVEDIHTAWGGSGRLPQLSTMTEAASAAGSRALAGDQRPERVEWRIVGDRILKCDTADHFLDHSWTRTQDIAFDLAGFIDEWELNAAEQAHFLAIYVGASGDSGAQHRLPFYHCVYNAHRLAMLDTAYHAGGHLDLSRLTAARQLAGERLIAALSPTAAPCG
jgi:hypothetical protein